MERILHRSGSTTLVVGQTDSGAIPLQNLSMLALKPTGFTNLVWTFKGATSEAGPYTLINKKGVAFTLTALADQWMSFADESLTLAPFSHIKVVAGAAQAGSNATLEWTAKE